MPVNWKIYLLALTLVIGPFFLLIPDFGGYKTYDLFLFSDIQITVQTWLYFLCEHAIILILAYIIAHEETQFKPITKAFFWIQVADTVDYLLTYNSTWVNISGLPVSMNTVGICIFVSIAWRYGRVDSD